MTYNPDIHHRRSIRLQEYDYSSTGAYFVTICTQLRECLFGDFSDDELILTDAGRMLETTWQELPNRFPTIELDKFIVMPNHFHAILLMCPSLNQPHNQGEHKVRPYDQVHKERPKGTSDGSIGRIIQAFKSLTTHAYTTGVKQSNWPPFPGKLWQRDYYEHVIRTEAELNSIREYIVNNPINWDDDKENRPT